MILLRPELTRSRGFDRWLGDFFWNDDPFHALWNEFPLPGATRRNRSSLPADFYEDAGAFYALLELPGVGKDDLELKLENSVLTVTGKYTDQHGEEETSYQFSRSLALPDTVDATKVDAEMKDGLLTITMPKLEETKPRSIEVK